MSSSSLSLGDSSSAAHTFLCQQDGLTATKYIEDASTLELPLGLEITHAVKAAGAVGTDRHLVKAYFTKVDDDGNVATPVVSVQLSVPRNDQVTATVVSDLFAYVKNYLSTDTAVEKFIQGINP